MPTSDCLQVDKRYKKKDCCLQTWATNSNSKNCTEPTLTTKLGWWYNMSVGLSQSVGSIGVYRTESSMDAKRPVWVLLPNPIPGCERSSHPFGVLIRDTVNQPSLYYSHPAEIADQAISSGEGGMWTVPHLSHVTSFSTPASPYTIP